MRSRHRAGRALLLALAATGAFAAAAGAADLGPHGQPGNVNTCTVCHNTARGIPTLRGWAGASLPDISSTAWAGRTISSLCYMCHTAGGGGYTASNMSANAYATGSHGFTINKVPEEPEGTAQGTKFRGVASSTLPYTKAAALECTSCHNVHRAADRPFLTRAAVAALCEECHEGRANTAPLRGTANSFSGNTRSFSTHPVGQALADTARARIKAVAEIDTKLKTPTPVGSAWALGGHLGDAGGDTGTLGCQTCHAVHGPALGTPGLPDLLAIDNTTVSGTGTPSRLCEGCHYGGSAGLQVGTVAQVGLPAGQWSDHPLDAAANRSFYPTGAARPANWLQANTPNKDRGAQPFYQGTTQSPVCSSCHDTHGGIAGTPLLRGPQPVAGWSGAYDSDDWCFACHPLAQVLPAAHHSTVQNLSAALGDAMTSQLGCGDCHGPAGTTDWKAHNGFWDWPATHEYSSTSGDFCVACHTETDPADLVAPAIKGQTFTEPASFPSTHGTVRGTGSHYIGPDSDEFPGVTGKITAWSTGYFSSYGPPNTAGGGNVAPTQAGGIICQSCHNVLFNDGKAFPAHYGGSANQAGWKSNLLVEPYVDDSSGTALAGSNVGSALCTGCHDPLTGTHHPLTGNAVPMAGGRALITGAGSLADAAGAPNTLSYPAIDGLDCDSCHRPHRADTDSDVAAAAHGARTSPSWDNRPTRHILEIDGTGHRYTDICPSCHYK